MSRDGIPDARTIEVGVNFYDPIPRFAPTNFFLGRNIVEDDTFFSSPEEFLVGYDVDTYQDRNVIRAVSYGPPDDCKMYYWIAGRDGETNGWVNSEISVLPCQSTAVSGNRIFCLSSDLLYILRYSFDTGTLIVEHQVPITGGYANPITIGCLFTDHNGTVFYGKSVKDGYGVFHVRIKPLYKIGFANPGSISLDFTPDPLGRSGICTGVVGGRYSRFSAVSFELFGEPLSSYDGPHEQYLGEDFNTGYLICSLENKIYDQYGFPYPTSFYIFKHSNRTCSPASYFPKSMVIHSITRFRDAVYITGVFDDYPVYIKLDLSSIKPGDRNGYFTRTNGFIVYPEMISDQMLKFATMKLLFLEREDNGVDAVIISFKSPAFISQATPEYGISPSHDRRLFSRKQMMSIDVSEAANSPTVCSITVNGDLEQELAGRPQISLNNLHFDVHAKYQEVGGRLDETRPVWRFKATEIKVISDYDGYKTVIQGIAPDAYKFSEIASHDFHLLEHSGYGIYSKHVRSVEKLPTFHCEHPGINIDETSNGFEIYCNDEVDNRVRLNKRGAGFAVYPKKFMNPFIIFDVNNGNISDVPNETYGYGVLIGFLEGREGTIGSYLDRFLGVIALPNAAFQVYFLEYIGEEIYNLIKGPVLYGSVTGNLTTKSAVLVRDGVCFFYKGVIENGNLIYKYANVYCYHPNIHAQRKTYYGIFAIAKEKTGITNFRNFEILEGDFPYHLEDILSAGCAIAGVKNRTPNKKHIVAFNSPTYRLTYSDLSSPVAIDLYTGLKVDFTVRYPNSSEMIKISAPDVSASEPVMVDDTLTSHSIIGFYHGNAQDILYPQNWLLSSHYRLCVFENCVALYRDNFPLAFARMSAPQIFCNSSEKYTVEVDIHYSDLAGGMDSKFAHFGRELTSIADAYSVDDKVPVAQSLSELLSRYEISYSYYPDDGIVFYISPFDLSNLSPNTRLRTLSTKIFGDAKTVANAQGSQNVYYGDVQAMRTLGIRYGLINSNKSSWKLGGFSSARNYVLRSYYGSTRKVYMMPFLRGFTGNPAHEMMPGKSLKIGLGANELILSISTSIVSDQVSASAVQVVETCPEIRYDV